MKPPVCCPCCGVELPAILGDRACPHCNAAASRASPPVTAQTELVCGVLGMMPLMVFGIEIVLGMILLAVGACFVVTLYLAFVGFVLWYLGLWIAIILSGLGAFLAAITLLGGNRYLTGKVLGTLGLLLHLLILAAACFALNRIHSSAGRLPAAPPAQVWEMVAPPGPGFCAYFFANSSIEY
jgi:hypothetical protein